METLPFEVTANIWQHLSIEDIFKLCQTHSQLHQICQDPYTWRFLLQRDFNITFTGYDPKIKYIQEYINDYREEKHIQEITVEDVKEIIFRHCNVQELYVDVLA